MAQTEEYDSTFQEKVLQALVFDHKYSEEIVEIFDPQFFVLKYLQFISDRFFSYWKKYNCFPTIDILISITRDELRTKRDDALAQQILIYLKKIRRNPDPGDMPFVKERTLEFFRKQSFFLAIKKAAELAETEKYDSAVEIVKNALFAGKSAQLGHDFFDDSNDRFTAAKRKCISTGIAKLDEIFNGGLGASELTCIVAATGVGKSHLLTMLGANAMRQKKNVLHYTFELAELGVGIRYDSNLCDIDSQNVITNKDAVLARYEEMKKDLGVLKIKQYPPKAVTVNTLRAHIEKLNVLKGFVPDIILVDYADLMRSTSKHEHLRIELNTIYEELRALATELEIPVVTASQTNKEGVNSDIIDVTNLSEAYAKAFVCDIIISLTRKSVDKASGWGSLYIAKNRAGIDGTQHTIKINTARSKLEVIEDAIGVNVASVEEIAATKERIRLKFKELQQTEDYQIRNSLHTHVDSVQLKGAI